MGLQRRLLRIIFLACALPAMLALSFLGAAENRVGGDSKLLPVLVAQPPRIDGVLDEPVWQSPPLVNGPFISNYPVYGNPLPLKTEVWVAYDADNIYFAFHCRDDQPGKLKASMTRRDNIEGEDWVGVDIDTIGNRRFTYQLLCNPRGVQADLINTIADGESSEPDWVWYSAGKVTGDGYCVEIRMPLKSFKFRSGTDITMSMAFFRFVNRLGVNASWPQISQSTGYFNSLVPVTFKKLDRQFHLTALPSVTYGSIWDRETPEKWSDADNTTQVGIGIAYGITSSISAEITVNPDFSQVESDQFQIEANQRFPLFYKEKRPFFMEVKNQFNLSGTGVDTNMQTAVHTRLMVDPAWGGKLTGEAGRLSFGILAVGDLWPGRSWDTEENPNEGRNANFLIGRLKYGFHGDNYVGLFYASRVFAGEFNRVVGADLFYRAKGNHNLSFNALYSFSGSDSPDTQTRTGSAFTMKYLFDRKEMAAFLLLEHMDEDFELDTAFYQRDGMTKFSGYLGPNLYPNHKLKWLKRFNPFVYAYYLRDHRTRTDETFFALGVRFNFAAQGLLRVDFRHHNESWIGRTFDQSYLVAVGQVQAAKWLFIDAHLSVGKRLLYDTQAPLLGNDFYYDLSFRFQPSNKLTQDFEYSFEKFDRLDSGQRLFDVNIVVSRTTYQFNKFLFIRGLVQYDSLKEVLLTDLLASFTLIPGTVVHLGYGSLHEKYLWSGNEFVWDRVTGQGRYYQTSQSFFFKVSYLFRF